MTEDEVILILRAHLESQFPKPCPMCKSTFTDLRDYLKRTVHLGRPFSYDAQAGDWQPKDPSGTLSLANCACGTTLALSSDGIGLWQLWRLMSWARKETRRRGVTFEVLMESLRAQIDARVLAEE